MPDSGQPFPSDFPSRHVRFEHVPSRRTAIIYLAPEPRACVTREVLDGVHVALNWIRAANAGGADVIRHLILTSDTPGVFSLGGDLDLFADCIRRGDRATMLKYALDCVHMGHAFNTGFEGTISTTSVVKGMALGGGLEGAACCQTIICEEGSLLQLPEIKFGMFPGMGAISYLTRRAPAQDVRRMVETGEPVDLQAALRIGMIDALTPMGSGMASAHFANDKLAQGFHGRMATRYALALAQGPSLIELETIARSWVDVAFKIDPKDLRLMQRLVSQQHRLASSPRPLAEREPAAAGGAVYAFAAAS
ncbi:MAG: crotonase/enoyl-CoA hydratase family protein [Beijerinckiaceae bacterium]